MKNKITLSVFLVLAIVLVVNLLSHEFHLRFDFTEGGQYTLSKATKNIINNLEEPVTIKAYFSKDLPPNIVKTRQDFQEMLIEYANLADGLVQYEFINPNEKEAYETEAVQNGIQPVMINIREKDQVKQQKAFLGATVSLGDKQEVIPFLQPGAAMEYALSTAIKKISVAQKAAVGFLQGHGEPSLREVGQLNEQLGVLYDTREITLTDTTLIPPDIKTLVIVRPHDSLPPSHLFQLNEFLDRGGFIAIAMNRVDGNLQTASGTAVNTGLEGWLQQKGVVVNDDFVIDSKCGSVTVQQQQGFFTLQSQVQFPFLPIVSTFADHPITKGLENVIFEFASSLQYQGDTTKKFTPLVFSSPRANTLKAPQYFDIQKQWTEADFPQSNIVMAAALEGKINRQPSKLVVVTDGDFVINGEGQQPRRVQPDNVNLLANAIDWLSDDTGLIDLRTKSVTSRPIDVLEDDTKAIIKYGNFLIPILLAIGYGIFRFQRNRITRLKRMAENYEEA